MDQENKRENKLKKKKGTSLNKTLNESGVDAAEEELGLQGATADDAEAEHIRQVSKHKKIIYKLYFNYRIMLQIPTVLNIANIILKKHRLVKTVDLSGSREGDRNRTRISRTVCTAPQANLLLSPTLSLPSDPERCSAGALQVHAS